MPHASASDSPHADRLLVVTGAVGGACIALARLASATGPAGTSWLMVLIQATVAAQGGAALLWVVRLFLRWLVGRVSGSHAVRDAYQRDDTATYAVLLLTLSTAVGVQLVAPVLCVLAGLFVAAQLWVLRNALPRRPRSEAGGAAGTAVALLFVAGFTLMLCAITWRRSLERQFGASTDLSTLYAAALMAGLGVGMLAGGRLVRWRPVRQHHVFVGLQLVAGLWSMASVAVIPWVAVAVGAAPGATTAAVIVLAALPTLMMGTALMALVASLPWPARELDRSVGWWWGAPAAGAALAGVVAVDVLFAFTGVRGTTVGSAALTLASALGAAFLFARRRRSVAAEPA